jgi:hypothetical protein
MFQSVFSPRDLRALYVSWVTEPPIARFCGQGGEVTNGGMVLVRARALKQLPPQRFSPSPFSCNAIRTGENLGHHRIGKTGQACTFET